MRNVLKRKDKTSVFCPQKLSSQYQSNLKVRFVELMIASVLIVIGAWIVILPN